MTPKIKSAVADTKERITSLTKWGMRSMGAKTYINYRLEILETILEALFTLERLQGVDLEQLNTSILAHKEKYEADIRRVEEGNKNFVGMNKDRPKKSPSSIVIEAAQLVADIRGK